jgi:putative spermidine/putrescine transport system permease protein
MRRGTLAGSVLLGAMVLVMLGPVVTVAIWAFALKWRYPHLLPSEWGLRFWYEVLERQTMVGPVLTSLALALLATTAAAIICWPAAYAFARLRFPGRRLLLFSFIAAQAVPKFALFISIAVIFLKLGLVGSFIGVALVQSLSAMLLMVWIPTAAFRGIPPALEEAALDLGASRLRVFLAVTLPQALPALAASYVLAFVAVLFEVDSGLLIGAPKVTTMPLLLMSLSAQVVVQHAAVLCVMIWVPCFVLLLLTRRFMTSKGIAEGLGA